MSDQPNQPEGVTAFLTWSEFLATLGMPPALRELSERQMRYGICSEADCQWPIAGWCVECRAKLCYDHLHEHRNLHARARVRAELLAHLVDDGAISAEADARERCRQRGICSEPDCEQPIDGWCEGCDAKLCAHHIEQHIRLSWQRSASGINANCGD